MTAENSTTYTRFFPPFGTFLRISLYTEDVKKNMGLYYSASLLLAPMRSLYAPLFRAYIGTG
jgi:hypothetical protein